MPSNFYSQIYAESYDAGDQRQPLVAFYLRQWEQAGKPSPVLEPMCGTGFFLIPFLEAGADIDGLDSSPSMLAICRAKCAEKELTPRLYEQLLEDMSLPRKYGFMFIPDRSFAQIYAKDAAHECLVRLRNALLPGGWLVLDIKTPSQQGEFGAPGQTEFGVEDRADGSTIFSTSVWGQREDGRVIRNWNKYERYMDGKLISTEIFDYNERFYDRAEFEEMLRLAGFAHIRATKGYDGGEPQAHDIIVYSCRVP
jgi:SAM-dependent methyltransferase